MMHANSTVLNSLSKGLRVLSHDFLFRWLLLEDGVGVSVVTDAFPVPLSQLRMYNQQCHCKISFLLYTANGTWIMSFYMVSDTSTDCEHSLETPVRPQTQTRPSEAACTTDITMTSGGRTGHPHQCGPRQQNGPRMISVFFHNVHLSSLPPKHVYSVLLNVTSTCPPQSLCAC